MEDNIEFFACDEGERLVHTNPDDALAGYLEQCSPLPKTVCLRTFKRKHLEQKDCSAVLKRLLEYLDDEYGDPMEDNTVPTLKMLEAEKVFIATVLDEYHVFACHEVDQREVDVEQWCSAHRAALMDQPG